jgi:cytochrome P450
METTLRPPGPGDRGPGIVGRVRALLPFVLDPFGVVAGRFVAYGDVYFVPDNDQGLYVFRHPDHLREVLIDQAAKFQKKHSAFEQLSQVLGQGLLTTDGDVWRKHRRMIQPAFSLARLESYVETMGQESERTCTEWLQQPQRDAARDMMALTLRIVCRTLFSYDVQQESDTVRQAMATINALLARPEITPAWLPTPRRYKLNQANSTLDHLILGVIQQRRASTAPHAPNDLLQALLEAVDPDDPQQAALSETEIRDHLVTLFLAGHETTAQALTWAWYLLAQHPEVEQRLAAEIHQVLGGRTPNADDLPTLVYTEQVIKETMRLYPPVYLIVRKARESVTIAGYTLPAGAEVALWVYMTQRDQRWFENPAAFVPERFAPGKEQALPKAAYLPFGLGPRMCIGKSFAMMEAKVILATLVQRFHGSLTSKARVNPKPRVTLTTQSGLPLKVSPRRIH